MWWLVAVLECAFQGPSTTWVLHEAWGCLLTAKQGLPFFISSLKFSVVGKVPRDLLGTLFSFAWPEDMNYGDSKDYREVHGIFEVGFSCHCFQEYKRKKDI
ncbi:hypothetical protein VNO77_37422 [Canavalia gladiata]|uniref:Secreted protein n=1 Tax=Canavalia gladiata TaxID=3824 RepID=A0AAN9KC31_CANGL